MFYDASSRTVFITKPGDPAPEIPEPDKKQDVVWNGNVKDFLNKIVENTDMHHNKTGGQVYLGTNGSQVSVGSPMFDSDAGANVVIVVQDWLYPGDISTPTLDKQLRNIKDNVRKTIEMYTSDTKAFSTLDTAMTTGKKADFKTNDGKRITFQKESSGLVVRLY